MIRAEAAATAKAAVKDLARAAMVVLSAQIPSAPPASEKRRATSSKEEAGALSGADSDAEKSATSSSSVSWPSGGRPASHGSSSEEN